MRVLINAITRSFSSCPYLDDEYSVLLFFQKTLSTVPFSEVISTRKVRAGEGATLYLELKCGNLFQQRVARLQTDQAHEIARLVRQYITMHRREFKTCKHFRFIERKFQFAETFFPAKTIFPVKSPHKRLRIFRRNKNIYP